MGDSSKFQSIMQYNLFNVALIAMIALEVVILIATFHKDKNSKKRDMGTRWLLLACYMVCIYMSTFMVSHYVPIQIREVVLPQWTSWIGIIMMFSGIVVRAIAVYTLKKAFTLNVQTTNSQQLITNGIYHVIRNPAYTGSIVSLVGVAVSYRSIIGICAVVMISVWCYSKRIYTEEIALTERFGDKFSQYKRDTWSVFPYIW